MLQLVLTGVLYLILVIPVGRYLYHIAAGKHTFADPVLDRIDDVIYKIVGVDPHRGMNWRQYFRSCSPVSPQWCSQRRPVAVWSMRTVGPLDQNTSDRSLPNHIL